MILFYQLEKLFTGLTAKVWNQQKSVDKGFFLVKKKKTKKKFRYTQFFNMHTQYMLRKKKNFFFSHIFERLFDYTY
jgi:hypothetical protein